jgi:hypothetical protein
MGCKIDSPDRAVTNSHTPKPTPTPPKMVNQISNRISSRLVISLNGLPGTPGAGIKVSCCLTTQAQRPGARDATIATATPPPGSLQRMVRCHRLATFWMLPSARSTISEPSLARTRIQTVCGVVSSATSETETSLSAKPPTSSARR